MAHADSDGLLLTNPKLDQPPITGPLFELVPKPVDLLPFSGHISA